MTEQARILLADDHPPILAALRGALDAMCDLQVVGEAADAPTTLDLCWELEPDVLALDLRMPGAGPFATLHAVRAQCPDVKVLVLSAYDNDAYVRAAIAAGVSGYMRKNETLATMAQAIRTVASGKPWFSQSVLEKLMAWGGGKPFQAREADLDARELAIMQMVVRGKTDHEISEELRIGERTVRARLDKIYEKLGVDNRIAASIEAVELGLVQK
jgi:DNA-binding NarL/FixJ family response regulator